jgi:hypothetical protein
VRRLRWRQITVRSCSISRSELLPQPCRRSGLHHRHATRWLRDGQLTRAARDPRPYTGGSCTLRLRRSTNSATDWHQPAAAPPASTPACAAPCRWPPPWPCPRDFPKRNPSQTVRDERFPEYRCLEEADERVAGGGSMNRKVKHGKRSPSGTQPLGGPETANALHPGTRPAEPAPNSQLTSVSAGQRLAGGRDRV